MYGMPHVADTTKAMRCIYLRFAHIQCESKKSPSGFLRFFPKRLGIFNQFFTQLLLDYFYTSTLDYKFLFKYLQL